MELTYEEVSKWLDAYFEGVNKNQETLEKVVHSKKYFTADCQFLMYTMPESRSKGKFSASREELLLSFVHPGIYEKLTSNYYVIDVKRMIAVVQFELQFIDRKTKAALTPLLQASAHYHLALDGKELKIKKIQYWTEASYGGSDEALKKCLVSRNETLTDLALNYVNTH